MALMKIRFSRHAKNAMRLWGISEAEVREVLEKGKPELDPKSEKLGFFVTIALGSRVIKVAFAKENGDVFVKTVFPLRKVEE